MHLYNWGEPLLNKNLFYFINELVKSNISVEINTNLSLQLSDEQITGFIESGTDRIEASIDGFSQASYGRYRINGDYILARDNMLRLVAARRRAQKDTELVWNYLVFRFNEFEVEAAEAFCGEHGITFVRREAAISEDLREDFLPSYRAGEDLQGFYEHRARPFDAESIEKRPKLSCGWHYFGSIVNADGSVSPCCAPWESDWDLGTVKPGNTSFSSIWNGRTLQSARADVSGHHLLKHLKSSKTINSIKTVDDFVRQGSICEGCQMPSSMFDLYAHRTEAVVDHYNQTMRGSDVFMDISFDLVRTKQKDFVNHYRTKR